MSEGGDELYFYHLEQRSLEDVLPVLLERSLARGWRAAVQVGSEARLDHLNAHLWTYSQSSFLAHGSAKDGYAAEQPIYLTLEDDNPNGAAIRFLIDGAPLAAPGAYARLVVLFDGRDEEAVARARAQWQEGKTKGFKISYWQQDEDGRWQQKG